MQDRMQTLTQDGMLKVLKRDTDSSQIQTISGSG